MRPAARPTIMRRALRTGCLLAVAAVLGGCSSSGVAHKAGPTGIRGTELSSYSCGAQADGKALKVAPVTVLEIQICPVSAPSPFNRPAQPISLARGSTRFESLLTALSLPDAPAGHQQLCPEYAELLPQILARTTTAAVLVHLPSDACGHSLPAVSKALSAVIN